MSDALLFEFTGVDVDAYKAVNTALGLDPTTGGGDWPSGMISHTGTVNAHGDVLVFEVWESRQAQDDFMQARLGPALGQAGVSDPTRIEWLSVVGHHPS